MARKKVKLAFITNDSARKASFKKRKKGLLKKVSELSILCGIEACAIVYSPYDPEPDVWPNALGVQRVVSQFKRMPEMERSKKMVNQESFIRQRISKANGYLKKQNKENRQKELAEVMFQCITGKGFQGMATPDLNDLGLLMDQKLKEIYKRMESLKNMSSQLQFAPPPPPAPAPAPPAQPPAAVVLDAIPITAVAPGGAPVEVQGEKQAMELAAMDPLHKTQWFAEWMNGDEVIIPFDNHSSAWANAFFL